MPWYENRSGEQLWYEDVGAGRPVVLLHGWCMSSAVWKFQYEGLAAAMRLLAPDLRGHGRSRQIAAGLTFNTFVNDLIDFCEVLKLGEVVLVGWSMGGQIALQACAEYPDRFAGLALVSATPCFTAADDFPFGLAANEAIGMRLKVQRNTRRALDGFYTRLFAAGELESHAGAAEIRQLLTDIATPETFAVLDALESLTLTDMRHLLSEISAPTLIINGAQDRICLPQASRYLKEHIDNAGQTVFSQCGHAPFLTYSRQFNGEISRFLRGVCEQNA